MKTLSRACAAEAIGTFFIVFSPLAWSAGQQGGLLGAALVSGLAVTAMIAAFGAISAAHFNPAVTLGFAAARRFPVRAVIPYIASQLAGALCAAVIAGWMFSPGIGAHIPKELAADVKNVGIEILITAALMLVIMAVATDRRAKGAVAPLAIGLTVVTGVLVAGEITGGSMNPARSLAPALFHTGYPLAKIWVYIVGPIVGAVLAAIVYETIRLEPEFAKSAPEGLD